MSDSQPAGWPLSAAQHGIWVGQQFDLKSPVYNAGECIEIRGPVDAGVFESALRQAVGEAEALHSRFVPGPTGPVQYVEPRTDWLLRVADVSGTPDPWATAHAWMREDLTRTVDLGTGPLFAQALFKAAPDRWFWFQRIHHIAMDGFGFSLLARRVADLYTARITGRPAPVGFGPLRPVLDEDAAYRAGPQLEADRAFWVGRFEKGPMPVSIAEPAPMSATFVRQMQHLSPAEVERMNATARQAGLTWPDLVLATTAVWLNQLTGAPEVVLGLPVMTRLGSAAIRVPCMAMNIVPLRVAVRPDAGLFALARDVATEVRAMRPHLRYRYEQLRRDLRRVGGKRRLFGPVVNLMPFDYALRFAGMPAVAHNLSAGPVEDLSIGMYARSDGSGMRVDFDANPACYSAHELRSHQRSFLKLLESLITEPERPVGPTPMGRSQPSPEASSSTAAAIDGGPLPAPVRPVLELFTERALAQPDAIAVEHGPYRLTYRELHQSAKGLADRLIAEGVRPDSPVAVVLPRSLDAIVAAWGVLFAGAGYLPVDPFGPLTRTASILEDAAPGLIVTTTEQGLTPGAGPLAPGNLVVKRPAVSASRAASAPRTDEDRLAYVIYTSGSTGQPNGVQIDRSALAHFVAGATHHYGMRADDRTLQFAPLHFDASVEEVFLTLCAGARLVLRTDEMLQSVPRLLDACAEHGITVLDLPTAFWHELAYSVSTGSARLPSSLRTVIIGGEAALPERVARWKATVGDQVRLLNTYGPTEATVVATAATLSGGNGDEAASSLNEVPIGRPLPGVRAVLLDAEGRPAAPGDEGELYLLGGGLARGYLGRPELTAKRFTVLDTLPGAPRAYRTGDRARLREDGQLIFVGRVDDEFKISGHRIDPAEVETVLLGHPGVREAAVVGQVLPSGARRLCAYLVTESPAPSIAELRRHVQAALPAPMVPGAFVFSERLPRTSTGKIDRSELRRAAVPEESAPASPAASGLEQLVLRVWEQVLGISGVSAESDFFDLGGQSLQSIQVANRLSVELGREVPVATVFRHPTAAALARALEQGADVAPEAAGLTAAMLADAELPLDVVPSLHATEVLPAPLRQVVLTGATGFVGAHLLDQLLRQTQARVVCPVRARDEAHAMERLREALSSQRLSTDGLSERVVALPADLTQPMMGLAAARFHGLASECDAVIHNAAVVSVVREYGSLQAVNVRGTRELLRLAAAVRPKPFHYVSTLAVAPQANLSPEVPEDFVPAHPGLRDGYQQSKWVAERLVQQAGERGLPVAVYRLGRVTGAPDTGLVNPQDLVWRILRAGVPVGALPQLDVGETWTPVDYVARALVRLAHTPWHGTVFNLTPTPEVRLSELFGWVQDFGYPVELLPVGAWRDRVAQRAAGGDHGSTLAFFDLRSGSAEPAFGLGPIRCDRVHQALAGTGIVCPPTDRALLFRYLEYCVAQGLLPPPPGSRTPPRSGLMLSH
ncbi:myxochelin non-ribosomal peptide synthetase MxcG [Pyxidicoccus fallax]|uniref:Amino acid adenylation domain-containing protein n=1 Tax=Pyxidicoccus fallax TaxID=394095 RepID=A0A848LRE6_9BACT|nr:myxochelin non-ribosomal peptide synthetase MxcG [Pyxidicoccus fallax]NMO20487.1 amino acid adenylation domain-containing protein [Pyxidicoccus fallax]NPC83245.1 myxochelin non-ribosomal peptide synthetase MxcG [Pyxidicoccus fallax]